MIYRMEIKAGRELSRREIDECISVIKAGCAVDLEFAEKELPCSAMVGIVHAGEDIVGVGAIKRPRPDYAAGIACDQKSSFAFDPQMHELGYVAVLEAHRGNHLSGCIVQQLLAAFQGPLWATTSNERMKKSLGKRGFVQQGKEWPSRKDKQLSLWIKQSK